MVQFCCAACVEHPLDFGHIQVREAYEGMRPVLQIQLNIQNALDKIQAIPLSELADRPIDFIEIEAQCMSGLLVVERFDRDGGAFPGSSPIRRALQDIRSGLNQLQHVLKEQSVQKILAMQKKATGAGFHELFHDRKALQFACKSGLIYTMKMFKSSGSTLEDNDCGIRLGVDNKVLFKVEGKFVPYNEVVERGIVYDDESGTFPGWNFIHPQGFCHVDSYDYDRLYPIARLSSQALHRLQEHVHKDLTHESSEDDRKFKNFIFQIVTSDVQSPIPAHGLTKNLREWFVGHASIRLITPDGDVFSCGTRLSKFDRPEGLRDCLATRISRMPTPDYAETCQCDARLVTSIAVTEKGARDILDMLNRANMGTPFCFPLQNCARIAISAASQVGIDIDARISVNELLWNCLPGMEDVPYVGHFLSKMCAFIRDAVAPIFKKLKTGYCSIACFYIKKVIDYPLLALSTIVKKISAVSFNILLLFFGAMRPLSKDDTELRGVQMENVRKNSGLVWFEKLLSWSDIFKDNPFMVCHSKLLKDWQLRQSTTVAYPKDRTDLCILP